MTFAPRRDVDRLRFGEERHVEESPCPGCGVYYFELHAPGCPVEECPRCGGRLWDGDGRACEHDDFGRPGGRG